MLRRKTFAISALVALALLLAACGQHEPPVAGAPSPDGYVTLSLGLEGGSLAPQSLTPQGVPYDSSGDAAVELVDVAVTDRNGQAVAFDLIGSVYTVSDSGSITSIPLTKAASQVQIALLEDGNPYTFAAVGFHEDVTGGSVIAYDSQEQNVTDDGHVVLSLTAVLGDAVLAPRYPTSFVRSGDVLDLMLVVMANGHHDFEAGDYLQVPMGDFTFDHTQLDVTGASILNGSNRGVRIEVDGTCTGEVAVSGGTVTGLVADGDDYVNGNVDIARLALACPSSEGSVSTDIENPEVTLTYDRVTGLAKGTATDNHRIADVRILDGTVVVASTNEAEIGGDVAGIAFIAGTNQFRAHITVQPLGGLVAVATDPSGNEGFSAETARVFVSEDGSGDGSEESPFGSLAQALAAVDDGGTVYVGAGTFTEQISLDRNVTIIGAGVGQTIIQAPTDSMVPVVAKNGNRFPLIDVRGGAEVSISNVTVSGPFPDHASCNAHGIRVVEDAILHLHDAVINNVHMTHNCQNAGAIVIGREWDELSGTAHLTDVEITVDSITSKAGIIVDGPGSFLTMRGGSVHALNRTDVGSPAQNGIQISRQASAVIDNVTISGFHYSGPSAKAGGILLFGSGDGVRIENSDLQDNEVGLLLSYSLASDEPFAHHIGNVAIANNAFSDNTWHIYNETPRAFDATDGNTFDGVRPGPDTELTPLFDIENAISHAINDDEAGLVRVVDGHIYVTQDGSIQQALEATEPGDVVNVQAGTYTPGTTLDITTPWVELRADPAGEVTLSGNGCTAVGFAAVNLAATGTTVNGFRVVDYSTTGIAPVVGFVHAMGNHTRVLNMDIEIDPKCRDPQFGYEILISGDDVLVEGNSITREASHGFPAIYFNEEGAANRTTIQGNNVDGGAIGGMVAALSPTIRITDNTIARAVTEGIWLAATTNGPVHGFENAHFTISGNTISEAGVPDITLYVAEGETNSVNGLTDSDEIVTELGESNGGVMVELRIASPL